MHNLQTITLRPNLQNTDCQCKLRCEFPVLYVSFICFNMHRLLDVLIAMYLFNIRSAPLTFGET